MWLDAPTVNTDGAFPGAVIPPCLLPAVASPSIVSSSGDDDNACLHRGFGRDGEWIRLVRLVHAGGNREIDDAHIQCVFVGDDIIERVDHVADVAVA